MNFKLTPNADMNGSGLLSTIKSSTNKIESVFPDVVKDPYWRSIKNQMNDICEKYSDPIQVTYGDTDEVYSIYSCFGELNIMTLI